jgi:phenylpropionate dioxygenase-like ring-hydroxylating dioxygenase large terminal subunit
MKKKEQIALLRELLELKQQQALFLDAGTSARPVSDYLDPERFEAEYAHLSHLPRIVAHASDLAGPNCFIRRTVNGLPLLVVRGDDRRVRVLLNVCRHRGTRLVSDDQGCRHRFSCPYHAWTWDSQGRFVGAPHFAAGFPGLDKSLLGLKALRCVERYGFVWLLPTGYTGDLDDFLAGLAEDFDWLAMDRLRVAHANVQQRAANWKLLVEGGLEAYHFRVAHRDTVAPLFNDNLSSYHCFGPHIRSVLPRRSITGLKEQPAQRWNIREHANLLYTLFPGQSLLVQQDHVVWIQITPIAVNRTELRLTTLVPEHTERRAEYWRRNHAFTCRTLDEDFDIAESIQAGLTSGANTELTFGRFEGALAVFNECLDQGINHHVGNTR